jgi:hypothetical protein
MENGFSKSEVLPHVLQDYFPQSLRQIESTIVAQAYFNEVLAHVEVSDMLRAVLSDDQILTS